MEKDFNADILYDVVVVGTGISGSIIAKELGRQGHRVLILEAGEDHGLDYFEYQKYNHHFYMAPESTPHAPFMDNDNAPAQDETDPNCDPAKDPDCSNASYVISTGEIPFMSGYERAAGGTTLHWTGVTMRMLPNDFRTREKYGRGDDWPVSYEEMQRFYRLAEKEIGISGDLSDQKYHGLHYAKDYVLPMTYPKSFVEKFVHEYTDGEQVTLAGKIYPVDVHSSPQGRNGMPNPKYRGIDKRGEVLPGGENPEKQEVFEPVGAVGNPKMGQRCEGAANCCPVCPVQAKYNSNKTLSHARGYSGVEFRPRTVVSTLEKGSDGKISRVNYTSYGYAKGEFRKATGSCRAKVVVLACNAIETPKILLASKNDEHPNGLANSSGQVGKNLMDHPVLLTWGLVRDKDVQLGTFRGPTTTSGVITFADGDFRKDHAPFRMAIGNWGWAWPTGAPESDVLDAIGNGMMGQNLRGHLKSTLDRQFRFACYLEQLPNENNYVTIGDKKDKLGNPRPVVHYDIDEYTSKGAKAAWEVSRQLFQKLGVKDENEEKDYNPEIKFELHGTGHIMGTHRMGDDPGKSVVNSYQQSHDHPNLYLAGGGSFTTGSCANPTQTMAALAFRSAEHIHEQLR